MSSARTIALQKRLKYHERAIAAYVAKILTLEEPCLTAARRYWEKKLGAHKSEHNKLHNKLGKTEEKINGH